MPNPLSQTVAIALPAPNRRADLAEWGSTDIITEWPYGVVEISGRMHCSYGSDLSPTLATSIASAMLAACWHAGYRPSTECRDRIGTVVFPTPQTPSWGDRGWVYFPDGSGFTAAHHALGVRVGGDTPAPADQVWAEATSLLAASIAATSRVDAA
ncbi:hypothetical protein GOEFS_051_00140 [Gordonia effusa NBRC 100432]|uniref:Uncharacterized protein n=1 Tax=Gordonia effusa NBRC 100432 TaxID=1077974 RepID=H0QZR8_9ACTN|nr:hypothetical protein [Gordonia effusa]GAB18319.1 hypothetical protein GOEFS_051_00140 [Gordonia effusa NBRC 100432]